MNDDGDSNLLHIAAMYLCFKCKRVADADEVVTKYNRDTDAYHYYHIDGKVCIANVSEDNKLAEGRK